MKKTSFLSIILILITACGGGSNTSPTPPQPDTTPNAFSIDAIFEAELDSEIVSNTITIQGINEAVPLIVEGCSYSLNQASYQTTQTTVNNSDTLSFKMQSSTEHYSTVTCKVQVSQYITDFTVTTMPEMLEVSISAKSSSQEKTSVSVEKLFLHDNNGENVTEVTITDNQALIPKTTNNISYTAYAKTNLYGETQYNLFTQYKVNSSQNHLIYPPTSRFKFDDCKTVELRHREPNSNIHSTGFYTSNSCNNLVGKTSYSEPDNFSAMLDISSSNSINDLIYFRRDENENFLSYQIYNSADYSDGDTIEPTILETDFNLLSFSLYAKSDGDLRLYTVAENGRRMLLGSHVLYAGANDYVMNWANKVDFEQYLISSVLRKNNQTLFFNKSFSHSETPSIFDDQLNQSFFISIDITDKTLSWNLEDDKQFSNAIVDIQQKINNETYFWRLNTSGVNSLTLPDIPQIHTNVFWDNASISIFLYHEDTALEIKDSISVYGNINCSNDVCSLNINL
ncbi:hypothetical protein [Aliikangiella sp. IMCC44359]|uniref:hypothetical protein n=1 Tax=Aliikangiella sp. IMCC44359 TaxID=3459125 RepID=UPI00403AA662